MELSFEVRFRSLFNPDGDVVDLGALVPQCILVTRMKTGPHGTTIAISWTAVAELNFARIELRVGATRTIGNRGCEIAFDAPQVAINIRVDEVVIRNAFQLDGWQTVCMSDEPTLALNDQGTLKWGNVPGGHEAWSGENIVGFVDQSYSTRGSALEQISDARELAARALCRKAGNPENTTFEGKPMWQSYLEDVDTVIAAIVGSQEKQEKTA